MTCAPRALRPPRAPPPATPWSSATIARQRSARWCSNGHYDVQPVDPLDLWHSDPFEVELRKQPDGETHLVGRGTSDDKGQLLTFIEACRAWRAVTGSLPVPVTVFLEGEEESGGKNLAPFMRENAKELTGDVALICDTDLWDPRSPISPRCCAASSARRSRSPAPAMTCIRACMATRPATPSRCWPTSSPRCAIRWLGRRRGLLRGRRGTSARHRRPVEAPAL